MRLSEAIRLGATMKPQCFGGLHNGGGSCALGAAIDAIGLPENADVDLWPIDWLYFIDVLRRATCPDCGMRLSDPLIVPIAHLNDEHFWTRERIADWVELQEPVDLGCCEHGISVEMDMNCPKCNEEAAVMVSYSERNPTAGSEE